MQPSLHIKDEDGGLVLARGCYCDQVFLESSKAQAVSLKSPLGQIFRRFKDLRYSPVNVSITDWQDLAIYSECEHYENFI